MKFTRYALQWVASDGCTLYHCIGKGSTQSIEEAHLFTKRHLVDKHIEYMERHTQWYKDVKVIEVTCEVNCE